MSLTKRIPEIAGAVAALVLAGCGTLDISNPNAPDRVRALSDPASVQTIAVGAFRTWYLTTQGGFGEDAYPALTLSVMARSAVAAWNNFNIRFYTGCTNADWDVYTAAATNGTCSKEALGTIYPRIEWQNNPALAQRTQIEAMWYGYYASLSSANSVLNAIRVNNVVIGDAANTKMVETMAVLTQGLALSGLALNYDQAFIVDYNTDLTSLTFSPATAVRDAARAKLDEAITLANANVFVVPDNFFGAGVSPFGGGYDHVRIAQIANTFAARLLAYSSRNSTENTAADWAAIATYASNGISSTNPFDLVFHQDACNTWCDFLKVWSNDMTTMRTHTRIAHLMDPATQPDPWNIAFNTNPNSPDHRLGDGTVRVASYSGLIAGLPDTTGNGGYDYAWSTDREAQRKDRGAWHQSAVGQIRYDSLTTCGDNPQGASTGEGDAPMVLAAENDLLWAEGLIRKSGPDLTTAATLINYTRVGPDRLGRPRGGLTAAAAGDGAPALLADVQYEQDVELPGSNIAAFYNQRRVDRLEPNTPHEMPVPAKELGVDQLGLYTCGGAANPDGSCQAHPAPPPGAAAAMYTHAPQVWADFQQQTWTRFHTHGTRGQLRQ